MNRTNALEIENISKSYGKVCALKDVSISIKSSEFFGLLGKNGAGKSTLFQLLTGLFTVDSGHISIFGDDISKSPISALSKVGVVFQQPTLDLNLSVFDNLKFHCLLHGMSRKGANSIIDDELSRFDLLSVKNTPAKNLSGGNRRKIELIRANLHSPKILLMDEATVGLDPESRAVLLSHVRKMCVERGLAVLWSTHIIEELDFADRIVLLNHGVVEDEFSPNKVKRHGVENDNFSFSC